METQIQEKRTTVKLKASTLKQVRQIGISGESVEVIVKRLVDLYNGKTIKDLGKEPKYVRSI